MYPARADAISLSIEAFSSSFMARVIPDPIRNKNVSRRMRAGLAADAMRCILRHDTITLLCHEPDGQTCHRHELKKMLSDKLERGAGI